jgi:hypothetical protein
MTPLHSGPDHRAQRGRGLPGGDAAGERLARFETTHTVSLAGLTEDEWIVVIVKGTQGTSPPMFPVMTDGVSLTQNPDLASLSTVTATENGIRALGVTNALFVDVDQNGSTRPACRWCPDRRLLAATRRMAARACALAVFVCAGVAIAQPTRAPGGAPVLRGAETAQRVVVGRIDAAAQIDRHGWRATLAVERDLLATARRRATHRVVAIG